MQYIANYEEALVHEAREAEVDGLVCGHIHHAELSDRDGILYCNDGDWVESCTALVESDCGELSLIDWITLRKVLAQTGTLKSAEQRYAA